MRIFFTSALLFSAVAAWTQGFVPQAALVVEEVPIPSAISSEIEAVLGAVPSTYRVYVELEENWELQFVLGSLDRPAFVNSSQVLYQHPSGSGSTLGINPSLIVAQPALAFDSWLTIGAENAVGNTMIELPDENIFNAWEAGENLLLDDFFGEGLFITTFGQTPQNYPDASGRVLIAQLTGSANIDGCFNLQFRKLNPDGTIFQGGTGPNNTVVFAEQYCFTTAQGIDACSADFNSSGAVTSADVLLLLSEFGCTQSCQTDLTGDGMTNTSDLLALLGFFGELCFAVN